MLFFLSLKVTLYVFFYSTMKLVIDLGNTFQKMAVFSDAEILTLYTPEQLHTTLLQEVFEHYNISSCLLSSVIHHNEAIEDFLNTRCKLFVLNHQTPLPIKNKYQTPETLGNDRVASAVSAHDLFPYTNVLVIDAGTCVKYDYINATGEYFGGAISPGLHMRFSALHTITDKLPLIDLIEYNTLIGTNTSESILSGVINGTIAEIDGIIDLYRANYAPLQIILSGGDADYLVGKLKNKIFAVSNIVLTGLKVILDYNDNNETH